MKNHAIGALVGGLVLFALGYLIYVVLMPTPEWAQGSAFALASKAAPNLPPIIVAEILFGLLLTCTLLKSGDINAVGSAAKAGAAIGGIIALAYSLLIFGTTEMISMQGVLLETVIWVVRWAVAGAVLSMVLGTKAKA